MVTKGALGRLPSEIRLAGWLRPTLFTPEAHDGQLVTLAAFDATLRAHEHAESLVVGTVRETQGATHTAYAAFCADPGTGNIFLVDLDAPYRVRFVNSGLEEFVACLATFVSAWARLGDSNEAALPAAIRELRSELAAIDATAVSGVDAFWPTSLESVTHGT